MSRQRLVWSITSAVATGAVTAVVMATPGSNVVGTIKATAGFAETVDIKFKVGDAPNEVIHVPQAANTVIQRIVFGAGGQSGWHSHPGPAIALVTQGELTLYSADDPSCVGRTYTAGQAFVDSGQGHVHLARNLLGQDTEVWVTYLDVPPGGSVRIDAADPGFCPS